MPARLRVAVLPALAVALLTASPVAAIQQLRVSGRVLGPGGEPAAGQAVVLHQVTSGGGTLVAQATAGDDGRFVLEAPGAIPEGAVYFVAARYDERLYIGPMLRPPLAEGEEVTLEVGDSTRALGMGVAPAAAPPAAVPPGGATGTSRRWLLLLAPLAGLLGFVAWAGVTAAGPARERRLLIRIARLDNRFQDAGESADAADYQKRRRRLLDELDASA